MQCKNAMKVVSFRRKEGFGVQTLLLRNMFFHFYLKKTYECGAIPEE